MKPITVNVSDTVYRDFQEYASKHDRTTSELIREAMELFRDQRIRKGRSVRELVPLSVGKVKRPLTSRDDLLDEMLDG